MSRKLRIDWPTVAALAVVVSAVVYLLVHLDTDKAEAWAAILPALLGAITTAYAATRGRAVERPGPEPRPVTPDLSDAPRNPPTPSGPFRTGEP